MNEVIHAIQNRRTIRKFKPESIDEEKLKMVLEAGRWAPSFSNLQPWKFIVVRDQKIKIDLHQAARETVLHLGIREAPVVICVCVDRQIDPLHALESGASAVQNMALAGYSLGLGVGWIGVYGTEAERGIQRIFQLPETTRVVALLPVGLPDESPKASRKPLEAFVEYR